MLLERKGGKRAEGTHLAHNGNVVYEGRKLLLLFGGGGGNDLAWYKGGVDSAFYGEKGFFVTPAHATRKKNQHWRRVNNSPPDLP